jgi:hypothetical protein
MAPSHMENTLSVHNTKKRPEISVIYIGDYKVSYLFK